MDGDGDIGSGSLAERLRAAAADLDALEPAVREAGPWPLSDRFDHSDEAAWGPPEILAHIDEMLPFWLGEAERILEAPRDVTPAFGRTATDEVRIALIGRDRTVPLRELFDRTRVSAARVARRIDELGPDDLERIGRHPVRGDLAVGQLLDRFVVTHLREHVDQLRDALEATPRLPTA
jgi:hypothetical protein